MGLFIGNEKEGKVQRSQASTCCCAARHTDVFEIRQASASVYFIHDSGISYLGLVCVEPNQMTSSILSSNISVEW